MTPKTHSNFTLRRLSNINAAAEGSNLPPRQFGELRVPIISGLRILSTATLPGILQVTLSWLNPEFPNVEINSFRIHAEGVAGVSQRIFLGSAPGSPMIVNVPAVGQSNVVLRVQTQLNNGLLSPIETSPSIVVSGAGIPTQTSGSPLTLGYRETAAATTLLPNDYLLNCTTGTYAVTLPTSVGITGQHYVIKNSGTGVITINTSLGEMIDNDVSGAIGLIQWEALWVVSTGAAWRVL
tara:strand:+ start:689 stop:1402 length:714 start_codon:yes stop_codon:yes gene_type:complete